MQEVVRRGASSMKVYTTYRDSIFFTRDFDWYRLMQRSGDEAIVVQVHAENDDILEGYRQELLDSGRTSFRYHAASRPEIAETEAVARGIAFARATGWPLYFVHLSSPDSVDLVERARQEGLPVFGEVCAHHISLDDSVYEGQTASRYVMTPPLRPKERTAALVRHVAAGRIQVIGSDHCGYSLAQRGSDLDFTQASPGIPGVETLWPVVYTALVASGAMDLVDAAKLVSLHPAQIFGLAPRKGALAVGADARGALRPAPPFHARRGRVAFARGLLAVAWAGDPRPCGPHHVARRDSVSRRAVLRGDEPWSLRAAVAVSAGRDRCLTIRAELLFRAARVFPGDGPAFQAEVSVSDGLITAIGERSRRRVPSALSMRTGSCYARASSICSAHSALEPLKDR